MTTGTMCYFCEEEVVFAEPSDGVKKVLFNPESVGPKWRHADTGRVSCNTVATPSNVEVEV